MSKGRRLLLLTIAAAYVLFWIGGVGTYAVLGAPPAGAGWTAPVFLLLAAAIVLIAAPRAELRDLAVIAGIGYASEFAGVHTGLVFSRYAYTDALGPSLFGVPIVMTCAWTVLVVYVRQITRSARLAPVAAALLGAAWMTAIDLVIDPLAAGRLGYWRWAVGGEYFGIPLHNFAGWFGVSAIILLILRRPPAPSFASSVTGWSIVLFFTAIALSTGLHLPGAIGIVLCVAHPAMAVIVARTRRHAGFEPSGTARIDGTEERRALLHTRE